MEFKKKEKKEPLLSIWTREQEGLLAEWAEKSSCYRWLHSRAEKKYRCRNYGFTIPVIILSTLSGTANFGMDSFVPEESKSIAMAGVGSVNIVAGIISTLANFLRFAELMEAHRSSGVSWSKLGRDISVELALDPKRRKPAHDFLNVCRAEYDRLIEQSPLVDDSILKQFHDKFKDTDINKPEMCNGLDKCEIYQLSEEEKRSNMMVNAAEKLKGKSFINNLRPPLNNTKHSYETKQKKHLHIVADGGKHVSQKHGSKIKEDNMKELSDIVSMGRVSAFSKKLNKGDVSPVGSVVDEINSVINDEDDINPSIVIDVDGDDNLDIEDKGGIEDNVFEDDKDINDEKDTKDEDDDDDKSSEIKSFLKGIDD